MKYYKKKLPSELEDLVFKNLQTLYMRDLMIELKEKWFDLFHNNYSACDEDYTRNINEFNHFKYGKDLVYSSPFLKCDYEDYNNFFNHSSGMVRPGYFGNFNEINNEEQSIYDAISNIFDNRSDFIFDSII